MHLLDVERVGGHDFDAVAESTGHLLRRARENHSPPFWRR
jgi:hypothetical protein